MIVVPQGRRRCVPSPSCSPMVNNSSPIVPVIVSSGTYFIARQTGHGSLPVPPRTLPRPAQNAQVHMRILIDARTAGLQTMDGPYAKIRNLDGYRGVARRSHLLGYDGKWVLHPGQIDTANEIYSPTQKQYDRAEGILAATARPPTSTAAVPSCTATRRSTRPAARWPR